ncbi:MFS general substrate transporter [Coemansia mojavensis]|nr:MFS general substrate transporter [Coemansia mojavensis]
MSNDSIAEKAAVATHENKSRLVAIPPSERDAAIKRLKLKLDLRLVPYLALLYLFNSLDRGNIGNARLAGLEEGTHLTGNDFYNALSFFYFGYTISQIPNMFIMKKVTPAILVGVTMIMWGVCSTSMAAAKSYSGLVAARFFMGIFEASVGPGAPIILSFFYLRHELAWRTALFFGSSTFAGAFGGLIAYGVSKNLSNKTLAPWQLLFIIEGVPTIFLGIITFFILPNSPETLESWFVTPQEKQVAIERARSGHNTDTNALDKRQLIAAFKDYKNIFTCLIYIGLNIPLASYTSFLPTIINLMGYEDAKAQLMTVPPYACAIVCVFAISWSSDRTRNRGFHVAGSALVACIGYILLISSGNVQANYVGACFVAMGLYPIVPLMLSWVANNNVGHTKRAVSIAMMNTFGQCFATVGTQIYKTSTAPRFFMGYGVCLAFTVVMIVFSLALAVILKRENSRRDFEFGMPEPTTPEEQQAAVENGIYDNHPGFRYFT